MTALAFTARAANVASLACRATPWRYSNASGRSCKPLASLGSDLDRRPAVRVA
jgi:hypothetical protein